MAYWELIFFWVALVIYALAAGGFIYSIVFKNDRMLPKLFWVVLLGCLAHTAAIVARFQATGHLPWSGDYEASLMGAWFIICFTLFVGWRNRQLQCLAIVTVPAVVIMMGFGYMHNPGLTPKAASLKTIWLYIHVYFAWLAFGAYTLAMAAGVLFLLKQREAKRQEQSPFYEKLPSLDRLDELIFRYVVFGFITDTIMMAAGGIWAKSLWGSYWNWDPVETWSLISWLIYGTSIHLRVSLGWRGSRLAWLVISALSTVIISFFGVNFIVGTSLHVFQVR